MSYSNLGDWCADIADAIRAKDGTSAAIPHQDFPARIASIKTGYTLAEVFTQNYDKDPLIIDDGHQLDYTIPPGVFYHDSGITSLIATDARIISAGAFANCTGMTSVLLGGGVFTIDTTAFLGCTSLETIEWTGVCEIGERAFRGCSSLRTATIGAYWIKKNAFAECPNLETVDITGTITTINAGAFSNCSALTSLILRKTSSGVPVLSDVNALSGTAIANGTGYIYINDELVNDLKAASNWSQYASQIKGLSDLQGE